MSTGVVLQIIAPILIIIGLLFMLPRFFKKGNLRHMLSWLCIIVGLVLAIIAFYVKLKIACVLCVLTPAFIIFGLLLVIDKFFCDTSCLLKFSWLCLIAGLVLIIVGLYIPTFSAYILLSIAYPVLLLGMLSGVFRYISGEGCCYMYGFSWLCVVAGLVLETVAVHV